MKTEIVEMERQKSQSELARELAGAADDPSTIEGTATVIDANVEGQPEGQAEGQQVATATPQAFTLPETLTINGQKISTKPWGEDKKGNAKLVKAHQDKIKATGKTLDSMILENAVQSAVHAKLYGDTSLMLRLLQSIPSGYHLDGLKTWLREAKLPFKVETDRVKAGGVAKLTMKEGWNKDDAWQGLTTAKPVTEYLAGAKAERANPGNNTDNRKPFSSEAVMTLLGVGNGGALAIMGNAMKNNGNPSREESRQFKGVEGDPETLLNAIHWARRAFMFAMANPVEVKALMAEQSTIAAKAQAARELARKRGENEIAARDGKALPHPDVQDAPTAEATPEPETDVETPAELQQADINQAEGEGEEAAA
jgi:hypothetical protein